MPLEQAAKLMNESEESESRESVSRRHKPKHVKGGFFCLGFFTNGRATVCSLFCNVESVCKKSRREPEND